MGIVGRSEASVDGPDGSVVLENSNLLLESYKGAVGIKTGYTQGAGNASCRRRFEPTGRSSGWSFARPIRSPIAALCSTTVSPS